MIVDHIDLKDLDTALKYAASAVNARMEQLGEHNDATQKAIQLYFDIDEQMRLRVHYFNYHVPDFMGFDISEENNNLILRYSEGDGKSEQVDKIIEISKEELDELADILQPAQTWDKTYTGKSTFDGEGFELTICHAGCEVESTGKYAFPPGYDEIHSAVLKWLYRIIG